MWRRIPVFSLLALAISALGSSQAHSSLALSTLQPRPDDVGSIEAQLKRFVGQTRFLNPTFRWTRGMPPVASPAKGAAPGGAQRAQQESDVFKVGKPGSKLLYLLNNYRGLQVVSFADGLEKPRLLGRVASTGNYPDEMYYDQAADRLLVLERYWYENSDSFTYSTQQGRVLVYDVKSPTEPRVSGQIALEGEIADSRMVGNVLYVATSVRPDWRDRQAKGKGYVYSIRLGAGDPAIIERAELRLPSSRRENMNIVEVNENGAYKYYLLAVLSESGWGWWDRKSLVEVVDISNPDGKIKPLMVVSAKGNIAERSQTHIKNNTLLVTSNYWPEVSGTRQAVRIAVEAFRLPTDDVEVLSEEEAQYRKLRVEHELRGKSEEAREALYEKLISDAELGLKGRFVRTAEGALRKILPDSAVTIGDTSGLNASLQDVRYDGDLLHVFWVPQNQIDPFDLFDISHPETGVKYLKRLYFDGWIERAIPITYEGRKFVLGLGWTVSNVNNDGGRRYPQAMLFEIENRGGVPRQIDIAQLTLAKGNVWTEFNSADKFIEMHLTSEGKGQVMFKVESWGDGRVVSGGKLIGFDLKKAVNGQEGVFQEGSLLLGNTGWLRRVFTNPEIDRVNAFSDLSLGTYDVKDIGTASGVVASMHSLELARNVEAYVTLGAGAAAQGVQLISRGNYWDESSTPETILRVVARNRPDAELPQTLSEVALPGTYLGSLVDSRDQSLWVATRQSKRETRASGDVFVVKYSITRVSGEAREPGHLALSKTLSWAGRQDYANRRWYWYGGTPFQLTQLPDGRVLAKADSELYELTGSSELALQALTLKGCEVDRHDNIELQFIGRQLFLSSKVMVEDAAYPDLAFTRNFAAPVTLEGTAAVCGKAVNIPGRLLSVISPTQWVTEDDRVLDIVTHSSKSHEVFNSSAVDSLKVGEGVVELADDYEMSSAQSGAIKPVGAGKLGFFDSQQQFGPVVYRYPYPRPYRPQSRDQFVVLGFDRELRFTKEVFVMPELSSSSGQLVDMFRDTDGSTLGILSNGRAMRALRWSDANLRPVVQRLIAVDASHAKAAPADSVTLQGWYYSSYGTGSGIHYTPQDRSLEVARGLFGVQQFYLE